MEVIAAALAHLLTIENFIIVNVGIFVGILFGAIPGMSANLGVTVFLPFTFTMGTVPGAADALWHLFWCKLWRFD